MCWQFLRFCFVKTPGGHPAGSGSMFAENIQGERRGEDRWIDIMFLNYSYATAEDAVDGLHTHSYYLCRFLGIKMYAVDSSPLALLTMLMLLR